jgi:dTDP-glucose 4,6-dehydratase
MTTDGPRRALVTGGAGFLGSHFVRAWLREGLGEVTNVDLLTYAGSEARLADVQTDPRYRFVRADVAEPDAVGAVLGEARPDLVVHFAAESHVTRSERDAERFHRTNVEGTRVMLAAAARQGVRRFVHISTDEVYGPILEGAFQEEDKEEGDRQATSPYARSKALADDVARSFQGLEAVVMRPTNCFGPWQFPEKAFARWVTRALRREPIPVWGDGLYVRQWLAAEDLAEAVLLVASADRPEPAYNVGPRHVPEITNLDLARWLAGYLALPPDRVVLTEYDRPDHDRRYAVDPSRIERLGWRASDPWERFASTVEWYRGAESWWGPLVGEAESIYSDDRPG